MKRHLRSVGAVGALVTGLVLAATAVQAWPPQKAGKTPSATSKKQQPARERDYTQNLEAIGADLKSISDELRAIREDQAVTEKAHTEEKESWWSQHPPVWSNWVLAFVAVFAGWIAYRAFTHERDAVWLVECADVGVTDIHANPSRLQSETQIRVDLKNFGNTSAKDVTFRGGFVVTGGPPLDQETAPPMILMPGDQRQVVLAHRVGPRIPNDVVIDVNEGVAELRLEATVTFRDVFSRRHSLVFEARWNAHQSTFQFEREEAHVEAPDNGWFRRLRT